jgi:hypothetical protein
MDTTFGVERRIAVRTHEMEEPAETIPGTQLDPSCTRSLGSDAISAERVVY